MQNKITVAGKQLNVEYVPVASLLPAPYNPRTWDKEATQHLKESIGSFGIVDPILVNAAPERRGIVIGGNFRLSVFKELGITECPVIWLNIPEEERERELCLRLNKNVGEWDNDLLATFSEDMLAGLGFSSEDLDTIFMIDTTPEVFDLTKELEKLDINTIDTKKGDVYELGSHRLMCGDSTIEADMMKLMDGERVDMCLTDPPYILDYLKGKKKTGAATEGFGLKRDRRYLETESLPDDFTELWMANIAKVQKPDFSIIVFENPKNLRTIWNELEKYWRYRNTIVWHLPNRTQGFSSKYRFFNKHDIALVGIGGNVALNLEPEDESLFETEYENALYATSGKPQWESYEKGKKICPTDFIEFIAADEKSSGQGIIFGTKPIEVLIPYLKVLTRRGDIVVEPFGGSGSTLIAAEKLGRRCRLMEKSPVYAEVIMKRFEKLTGIMRKKIVHGQ
jgi:DNA modification methylase